MTLIVGDIVGLRPCRMKGITVIGMVIERSNPMKFLLLSGDIYTLKSAEIVELNEIEQGKYLHEFQERKTQTV